MKQIERYFYLALLAIGQYQSSGQNFTLLEFEIENIQYQIAYVEGILIDNQLIYQNYIGHPSELGPLQEKQLIKNISRFNDRRFTKPCDSTWSVTRYNHLGPIFLDGCEEHYSARTGWASNSSSVEWDFFVNDGTISFFVSTSSRILNGALQSPHASYLNIGQEVHTSTDRIYIQDQFPAGMDNIKFLVFEPNMTFKGFIIYSPSQGKQTFKTCGQLNQGFTIPTFNTGKELDQLFTIPH